MFEFHYNEWEQWLAALRGIRVCVLQWVAAKLTRYCARQKVHIYRLHSKMLSLNQQSTESV